MDSKLYLIPNSLNDEQLQVIPAYAGLAVSKLRYFMVEGRASAERFLKRISPQFPCAECIFFELSEHTPLKEAQKFFEEHHKYDIGIISESGCPCVADPGAAVVRLAHQKNIAVVPLVGPSSILLALMASGLSGQNFAFNGYLPKDKKERLQKIKTLEKRACAENQTQIFMETPYRNQSLFEEILSACQPNIYLCVVVDLTGPAEYIKTLLVKDWQTAGFKFDKKPALFLIGKA